jgi:hypothetical protein
MERDPAHPHDGPLKNPKDVPSRIKKEMKHRDPAADRHANASFDGPRGEPTISDAEPPRGRRGLPEDRSQNSGPRKKP